MCTYMFCITMPARVYLEVSFTLSVFMCILCVCVCICASFFEQVEQLLMRSEPTKLPDKGEGLLNNLLWVSVAGGINSPFLNVLMGGRNSSLLLNWLVDLAWLRVFVTC